MNLALYFRAAFLVGLCAAVSSYGDVGLIERRESSITVTQKAGEPWKEGEEACVVREDNTLGCGEVTDSNYDNAQIELGDVAPQIKSGDRIQTYEESVRSGGDWLILGGIEGGFGYWFPTLGVQFRMWDRWFLGVMGSLSKNTTEGRRIESKGLLVSVNHYSLLRPFPGFWFRAGAGAYFLSVTDNVGEETSTAPYLLSTVGWRGNFNYLSVGIGVGVQYLPNNINRTLLGLRNLEPVGTLDVGLRF